LFLLLIFAAVLNRPKVIKLRAQFKTSLTRNAGFRKAKILPLPLLGLTFGVPWGIAPKLRKDTRKTDHHATLHTARLLYVLTRYPDRRNLNPKKETLWCVRLWTLRVSPRRNHKFHGEETYGTPLVAAVRQRRQTNKRTE